MDPEADSDKEWCIVRYNQLSGNSLIYGLDEKSYLPPKKT